MNTHDASDRNEVRSVPPRSTTSPAMIVPASRNRVDAANSGCSVLTASAMKRYVEPQIT